MNPGPATMSGIPMNDRAPIHAVETARLRSYALRPGVTFPDWTLVASPHARAALLTVLEAFGFERTWRGYSAAEDALRVALLRIYAERGCAPAIGELATTLGADESTVRSILARLKARDLVVLDDDGERIIGAYPFTDRETDHRVKVAGRTINAMCAIDALGAGALYGCDIEIGSRCRACGAPITITTCDEGRSVALVQPGTAIVWSGIRRSDGCAASSLCTVIAFFCGGAHSEVRRREHSAASSGFRLSIDEALQAGRALFGPTLASR